MIRNNIQSSRINSRLFRLKHSQRQNHTLVDLQPTITRQCYVSTQTKKNFNIPLSISDVHLRHEQLPFAYFFDKIFSKEELEASLYETLEHFPPAGGTVSNYQTITCTTADTVPLTFAEFEKEMTMEKWLDSKTSRDHYHSSENGHHPTLNQLFQPLFINDNTTPINDNLMTIQVTQFANNTGTSIGINTSHLLGDTASCIRFAECWGKTHSQELFSSPCFDRSYLSCSGMMTEDISDSLNLDTKARQSSWWDDLFASNDEESKSLEDTSHVDHSFDHEYVRLSFSSKVLVAMKDHAMKICKPDSFISTNDTIMAASWMFKRALSKANDSNLSIVVNLRGKCGIDDFDRLAIDQKPNSEQPSKTGLYGNGITNIVASHPPTASTDYISMSDIANASISIRQTLIEGLEEVPSRISHSRIGVPIPSALSNESSSECFSVTSWRQFSSQDVSFAHDAKLIHFHGQPSHPLPKGATYSSVVHNNFDDDGHANGSSIELFMPSSQVEKVTQMHSELCSSYLQWHKEINDQ